MGDAGAFIRLLLGLWSNLHTLVGVETVCLRWATSTSCLFALVYLRKARPNGEAVEGTVEVGKRLHTVLLYLMINFWLFDNWEDERNAELMSCERGEMQTKVFPLIDKLPICCWRLISLDSRKREKVQWHPAPPSQIS